MSDIVIQVENLSKQYRLGTVGTGSLAHDLNRWWYRVRGKPDPYLKVTQANDRAHKGDSEYVWALRDIDFGVKRGEVLGIIGRNGAGKSTLLKILSRITAPTTGEVRVKGRIGSLLEVGTGFHPELTGRENIFLNGAILGMTKAEIRGKLDEIVDFSGCERYLDTPVKRYSSGMMVRLGFAVAAHLEPEILVVDEVLAVGDLEFQRKCVGKMKDVAEHGRTVLFVSHNMASISSLCSRGIVLHEGRRVFDGGIVEAVDMYTTASSINSARSGSWCSPSDRLGLIRWVRIEGEEKGGCHRLDMGQAIRVAIHVAAPQIYRNVVVGLDLKCGDGTPVAQILSIDVSTLYTVGNGGRTAMCELHPPALYPGEYTMRVVVTDTGGNVLDSVPDAVSFSVQQTGPMAPNRTLLRRYGNVHLVGEWS